MPFVLFALVVAWAAMLLFGGLDLDRALLSLLHGGDSSSEIVLGARIASALGSAEFLIPLTLAGGAWLVVRRRIKSAAVLILAAASGRLLVEVQKAQTARIRPADQPHLVDTQNLAFPSGHAANATIVFLALAFLLTSAWPRRPLAVWGAVWLSILVGVSRLVLGVHWPSDVIAGWAFGLFWALLLLRLTGHDLGDGTPRAVRHSFPEGEQR
ncbi:MAG TPA: phosphatase PAP2 family protein [Allosphingosinicella sp.]|nr:phosphatase PAP2 family protein [Allosphingosinicella sp.]